MVVVKTKSDERPDYLSSLPALMRWTEYNPPVVVVVTDIMDNEEGGAACCIIIDPADSPFIPFDVFDGDDMIPVYELEEFFGQITLENK